MTSISKVDWKSSSHPISDIRDWSITHRLEMQPDFQRNQVWSKAAKIMLIDTILRNIPMPKIFLQAILRDQDTYRIVIDGQQRLTAILEFLNNDFALDTPYEGPHLSKRFIDLPQEVQHDILNYNIDINEIRNATKDVIRDVYSRVNKYTVQLNKQELRRADVIVVDPPRKGCDAKLLETMLTMAPSRIVYVSCDPATLARDLKILCEGGYRLTKVHPVDQFPGSVHVENCCLLEREWKG